ncbi:nuclear autoantigenic sperm protein-like isoform X2 [Boleophthalmus pectinirostris]|uniref:nuclear autoantigenic sperm protein-like isoform X2 n=1 Tax=Boleophthalmus pectinirostris TaxID=150288 RepID=UPI002431BC03|nr:nuclear autoantigenic sperm protein-like isoform X2 [Boleophthalmus pectinirostris]
MPEQTAAASVVESVEEKPCSSTSATDSTDVLEEAKKLIGTGNRHLVMGDVVSAVSVFQDACSMLAARYGDTADECGEAFFLCGKSLLELARMENTVLGNALEGVPEEDEGEEEEQPSNSNIESASNLDEQTRDELRKQVYEAMAEEEKPEPKQAEAGPEEAQGDSKSEVKQEVEPNGSGSDSPKVQDENISGFPGQEHCADGEEYMEEGEQEDDDDVDDDDDDDDDNKEEQGEKNGEEEEVGNLQLAWEMLEVAKVIYKRKDTREDQLMAAQTYLKLGEVSAESGNYPQALEDFQECLALQLKHLPPHSRLLAETHYHVATTLCYMDQYDQAIQHYSSSIRVIEARLAMLQEVIDKAGAAEAASEEKNELEELKLLLPEIRDKVDDAKESQRTASAASRAIQQTLGGASTSSGFSENGGSSSSAFGASQIPVRPADGASSSVSDISHLVRKKRKADEDSAIDDSGAKQAKREVNGNGDSSASDGQQEATQSASSTERAA